MCGATDDYERDTYIIVQLNNVIIAMVLEVMHPEDPVQSSDECNGREDVPLDHSSGDVEWLGESHRAIGVSVAHYSGGCRKYSLHEARHQRVILV